MEREQLIGAAKSVENQDRPPFLTTAGTVKTVILSLPDLYL